MRVLYKNVRPQRPVLDNISHKYREILQVT
uniref:Uncharacterized protein n=1 Tax=Anguilla anguilla TaxID=7936 RepID=A0A0E9VZU8_ANGAN